LKDVKVIYSLAYTELLESISMTFIEELIRQEFKIMEYDIISNTVQFSLEDKFIRIKINHDDLKLNENMIPSLLDNICKSIH